MNKLRSAYVAAKAELEAAARQGNRTAYDTADRKIAAIEARVAQLQSQGAGESVGEGEVRPVNPMSGPIGYNVRPTTGGAGRPPQKAGKGGSGGGSGRPARPSGNSGGGVYLTPSKRNELTLRRQSVKDELDSVEEEFNRGFKGMMGGTMFSSGEKDNRTAGEKREATASAKERAAKLRAKLKSLDTQLGTPAKGQSKPQPKKQPSKPAPKATKGGKKGRKKG